MRPLPPRQPVREAVVDENLGKSSPLIKGRMTLDFQVRGWIRPQPSYEAVALEGMLKVVKRVVGELEHREATIR